MNRKEFETQLAEAMEGWGSTFERANILAHGVERRTKERDELQKKLEATKGKAICIYCQKGYSYKTPEEQKALTEHILSCEKNPVLQMAKKACDILDTLLDRCCDHADGAPDATDLGKFCNELVGIAKSIALDDIFSLRQERDQLRKELEAAHNSQRQIGCGYCGKELWRYKGKMPPPQADMNEALEVFKAHDAECNPVVRQWRQMADRLAESAKCWNNVVAQLLLHGGHVTQERWEMMIASQQTGCNTLADYHKLKQGETK